MTQERFLNDDANIDDNRLEDQQGKNSTSIDDLKQAKAAENSFYQVCITQKADLGEKSRCE